VSAQLAHHDDGLPGSPSPRAVGRRDDLAIDDFTADNGATCSTAQPQLGQAAAGPDDEALPVVMPAGSCVLFVGTLGTAAGNSSTPTACRHRAVLPTVLRPMRPSPCRVAGDRADVSDDIRRMLGYSIHPPFVGAVDVCTRSGVRRTVAGPAATHCRDLESSSDPQLHKIA